MKCVWDCLCILDVQRRRGGIFDIMLWIWVSHVSNSMIVLFLKAVCFLSWTLYSLNGMLLLYVASVFSSRGFRMSDLRRFLFPPAAALECGICPRVLYLLHNLLSAAFVQIPRCHINGWLNMEEESLTLLQLQDLPNQFEGIGMVIELDAFVGPVRVVSSCK